MKKTLIIIILFGCLLQPIEAQTCKTNSELDNMPGKYLTAAEYPWPAVRAEYFNNLTGTSDKTTAKQILGKLETLEQQTHSGFSLTGGNWENYYSTEGYHYLANTKLGSYTFQSALYEFFCLNGKPKRNGEYSTVLRMYVNKLPINTLNPFLRNPFGSSFGGYDFGFQFKDWKNHKPADVNAQLISLFSYMACNSDALIESINSGNNYFQDVVGNEVKPNNRNIFITRYWFITNKNVPLLLPVTRKEYLESLLEYYEREKLHFPKLIAELTSNHDSSLKRYNNWEKDVADKIAIVNKTLKENNEDWLNKQAIINQIEDSSLRYNANLSEETNANRFWKFYGNEKKSERLYRYNPAYFKPNTQNQAKPQLITIAFRYVTIPSSIRLLENFSANFGFDAVRNLIE